MSVAAAVTWSAIAEPDDPIACWLVDRLGPAPALEWLRRAATDPVGATVELAAPVKQADAAVRAVGRWTPRLEAAVPERLVERAERLGARVVVAGDEEWPQPMNDLGPRAPYALWIRGHADLGRAWTRSVAIVGARAATAYGEHVASGAAASASDRGITVVSGGAYGIDAAAHRGALAADGVSIAVLAGGVDRLYPTGNALLLERLMDHGAVVSEQPPGFAPHRSRFLSRNRLIATAGATVVVEAAPRSGALSTARHAAELARPVGAVPGAITSPSSAGCHRLIRDGMAILLGEPADVLELVLPLGEAVPSGERSEGSGPDFATSTERQAYGAIPRRGAGVDAVGTAAGLTVRETLAALGALESRGLVTRLGGSWHRVTVPAPRKNPPDNPDIPSQTIGET
ncbi:DNA-processing protein DprA [Demequina sp.]|uniref:DNA-processing protein DprA n=1 Tax=Demequina sp. TaxID=2050685 RepID=UPI0025F354FB|nr:DNA-processing protein DprA [Demequina sp.]